MERVTGIGGVFFRARNPESLSQWYAEHLGVPPPPSTYDDPAWWQEEGPTIWGVFPADSPDLGDPPRPWGINFRVRNLDAMVAQLRAAGIVVAIDPETYPNGRFAQTADPEGNPIQLWEPTPDAPAKPVQRPD